MISLLFFILYRLALFNHGGVQAWCISRVTRFAHRSQTNEAAAVRTSLSSHLQLDDDDGIKVVSVAQQYAESSMLKGSLRFGSSKPKSIVALFPGVGGSANNVAGLGKGWLKQNPDTQVIIFEVDAFSGYRALSAVWNLLPTYYTSSTPLPSPAVDGYDYNNTPKVFDATKSRSNSFFGDILLTCCNDVSLALQEVLVETGLTDDNLILAGFSQGASIAAYTGFMRNAAGIILMGGPGAPQRQLLPPPTTTTTQVCIISGDSDPFAPHEALITTFRPYNGGEGGKQYVRIIPDLSHQIVNEHVELGGAFISTVLNDTTRRR